MAKILYVIVFIALLLISCPIVYIAFQILLILFGSTYDDLTGTNDFFMWSFS